MKWRFLISPEWIWRYVILAGVFGQMFLNSHYVTRTEYSADKERLDATLQRVNATINDLQWTMKLQAAASERLIDHESRIRVLENKRP